MYLPSSNVNVGDTPVSVGSVITSDSFICPHNTDFSTIHYAFLYSKGQTGIFPEKNLEKEDDLLPSPYELSTRKVEGGIFIEVFVQPGKFTIVERGKNGFSDSPVATGSIHRNASPEVI